MIYEVLGHKRIKVPRQDIVVCETDILVDGASERETVRKALVQAARELMDDHFALKIQAFIEREAVQWRGYVAYAIADQGGGLRIYFDNDPFLRYALWLAERE